MLALQNQLIKMNYYEEEMHQNISNNQSDTSVKDQNLQQKLANSRKSKQSIQTKIEIIKNLSQKIILLQKKSKSQKINIYQLFADKNQIDQDFQNYQKTKMLYLQEKIKGPLFKKYQYVDSSGENNTLRIQNYKNHAKSTLAHTQTHSQISQKQQNKTFKDAQIQTAVVQQNKINQEKAEQYNFPIHLDTNFENQNQRQSLNQGLRIYKKNQEDIEIIAVKQTSNKYEYFANEIFFPQTHLPLNSSFSLISEDGQERQQSYNRNTPLQTERYFKQNSIQIQNFQKSASQVNCSFQNLQQRLRIQIQENNRLRLILSQMQKTNFQYKLIRQQAILGNQKQQQMFKYSNLKFYHKIFSYNYPKQKAIETNVQNQNPLEVKRQVKIQKLQNLIQQLKNKQKQFQDQSAIYQNQIKQLKQNYHSISIKYEEIVEELALTFQSMQILSINFKNKQNQYLAQIKSIQSENQALSNTIVAFRNKVKEDGIKINYSQVQMLQQIISNRQKIFSQEISKSKKESHEKIKNLTQNLQNQRLKLQQMEKNCLQIISMYDQEISLRDQNILQLKKQIKNNKHVTNNNGKQDFNQQNQLQYQQPQLDYFKQLKSQYKQIDYLLLQHNHSRVCYQLQKQVQQNLKLKTKFDNHLKNIQIQLESQKEAEQSSHKDLLIIEQLTVQLQKQYKKNQFLNKQINQKQSISAPSQNLKHTQLKKKLQKMRKYAKILQSEIQAIYKVSQCQGHCSIIQKLSKFIEDHTSLDKK